MADGIQTAVFRADASPKLGVGHVMRCLTLADELARRGWRCRFACTAETVRTLPALADGRHQVVELPDGRESDPAALLALAPAHWLVVDHYGLDGAYERALGGWAAHILVIDDLADRPHVCDVLMDQTIGRPSDAYRGLTEPGTLVLAGPAYGLLRPDFAAAAPDAGRSLDRILVSMGGTDAPNATCLAIDAIARVAPGLPVSVVLGGGAPHLAAVRDAAARLDPPAEVLVDVKDMAALMAGCGLAVGAAGSSALERCRMALPSVAVVTADNQRAVAAGLEAAGAAAVCPMDVERMAAEIGRLCADQRARRRMAAVAAALCPGRGAALVADAMAVSVHEATPEDRDDLLAWGLGRTYSVGDTPPIVLVATLDGVKVGAVRFDAVAGGRWRLFIVAAPENRGRGMGWAVLARAIQHLVRQHGSAVLVADISAGDQASRRMVEACGFTQTGRNRDVVHYQRST